MREMAIGPSGALPISALCDGNLLDNPKLERHLLCGRGGPLQSAA
jgi:hypothetical protein